MKKLMLILPLLLVFMGCEEDAEDPTISEILTGTWTVSNMGVFADENCSGALDYSEWAFAQAFGITMKFVFKTDGTVDLTATVFGMPDTETMAWTATDDEICIDGECASYTLSNDNKTLKFIGSEDAYCEDTDGNDVDMTETECGTAGNDWFESACYEYTMSK